MKMNSYALRFASLGAAFALLGLVAGCAVSGDARTVSIEHPANQFLFAEIAAKEHCTEFGKQARHLKTSPRRTSSFILQSRISVFSCENT